MGGGCAKHVPFFFLHEVFFFFFFSFFFSFFFFFFFFHWSILFLMCHFLLSFVRLPARVRLLLGFSGLGDVSASPLEVWVIAGLGSMGLCVVIGLVGFCCLWCVSSLSFLWC